MTDSPRTDTSGIYAILDALEPDKQSLIDSILHPADKTTMHELLQQLKYDYDPVTGRRLSQNVEDRRHHKPPSDQLHRLSIGGEAVPAPDFIPKAEYPAGSPSWLQPKSPTEYDPNYSLQNAFDDIDPPEIKPEPSESIASQLKETAQLTLWNILTKLEEMGWK